MKKRVLVIAAHPDDEVLGCGATMAKCVRQGMDVYSLILGEGVTARGGRRQIHDQQLKKLTKESDKANRILGVKKVYRFSLPDNKFDSIPLLDIVKCIEMVKDQVKPNFVYTHHAQDVNVDHQRTFQACLSAFRPQPGEIVDQIYSFYVLSSTDWQAPQGKTIFSPNTYVDVLDTINLKVRALKAYGSEIRRYPHPRSAEGIRIEAKRSGLRVGLRAAEAFETVRHIKRGQI